jgi:hypothetical protein
MAKKQFNFMESVAAKKKGKKTNPFAGKQKSNKKDGKKK